MSETSGGLPLMAQTQNSRYLTFNELAWAVNVLQTGVLDRDLTAPPGGAAEGDAYIVNGPATGAWAGHEDEITFYFDGIWNFLDPELAQGNGIYVIDEGFRVRWNADSSPTGYEVLTVGSDASTVSYSPAAPANWNGGVDPGDADDALDQLAERVADLESSGGGGLEGLTFTSDTGSTADSDPGNGLFKWNNATQSSATVLYFDNQTLDGVSLSTFYAGLPATGYLYLEQEDDDSKWQLWKWSAVTNGTGYYKFTVTLQASGGSIADDKTTLVDFKPDANTGGGGSSDVGRHMIPIPAAAMFPSPTSGCASLSTFQGASGQPSDQVLLFDASTQEYAEFSIEMPESWDEGTVTFIPGWSHGSTATNFGVVWTLQAVAISNDDALAASFGTAQSSADTGGTTDDLYKGPESSAITIAGTPAAGDRVFFRISRLVSDGGDTLAIDARLHGIRLYINTAASTD